jgi:hypothetical protein
MREEASYLKKCAESEHAYVFDHQDGNRFGLEMKSHKDGWRRWQLMKDGL